MKWLAAAAGVVVAGAVSLLFVGGRDEPVARRASQPQAVPAIASAPRPAPAPRVEPVTGVSLHGVLLRGAQSQALLTVDGQQQSYGVGDAVKGGWTVQTIREQQVVLTNGSASTAIGVAAPAPATGQPGANTAAAASASAHLPGFVAGAAAPLSDAGASERNRRFLDAVQKARARQ